MLKVDIITTIYFETLKKRVDQVRRKNGNEINSESRNVCLM